jgi:uridine kinase
MTKKVPKTVHIIGAPCSGKKTMASEIANQLGLNICLKSPESPDQFTILYDIPEEEMESRGAYSGTISRFM